MLRTVILFIFVTQLQGLHRERSVDEVMEASVDKMVEIDKLIAKIKTMPKTGNQDNEKAQALAFLELLQHDGQWIRQLSQMMGKDSIMQSSSLRTCCRN